MHKITCRFKPGEITLYRAFKHNVRVSIEGIYIDKKGHIQYDCMFENGNRAYLNESDLKSISGEEE